MNGTREEVTNSDKPEEVKESNEEKPNTEVRSVFLHEYTNTIVISGYLHKGISP